MARRKVFDNVRLAPDGKMIRDVSSPGGTFADTQTLADTPNKRNKAWQYEVPPSATAGAAAELRKANGQACRNVRKKVKGADKSEEAARESLAVRALLAGIHRGPLGVGPERVKAQRALSQEVRRAELSVEDLDALNEEQKDRRAGQNVQKRDALNAWQKAYDQVTIGVRFCIARPVHTCALGCR
jgi:hypothetical protein